MVKVGIIGVGVIGQRLLPHFIENERTDLVGIYDVDDVLATRIGDQFDVQPFKDYKSLVEAADMLYVAVPPKFHYEISETIMKAGKHVFCEKPLASTIEEAEQMTKMAKETGVVNGMNFPVFYGYAYQYIKNLLSKKSLGNIKRIELKGIFPTWPRSWQQNNWIDTRDEGGFTREIFTHFIQIIQHQFGDIELKYHDAKFHNGENRAETHMMGIGAIGDIEVLFHGLTGVAQDEDLSMIIYGDYGKVELVSWREIYLTFDYGTRELIDPEPVNGTLLLINALYDAVEGKPSELVSFEEGMKATKIVETLLGVS